MNTEGRDQGINNDAFVIIPALEKQMKMIKWIFRWSGQPLMLTMILLLACILCNKDYTS